MKAGGGGMRTDYERDFYLWALEQADLLRRKRFVDIDVDNLAEEIESVARHAQREITSRMRVLIKHLLKWRYQPARRCASWENTIEEQRHQLNAALEYMPSLRHMVEDPAWLQSQWTIARRMTERETRVTDMPEQPVWTVDQMLDLHFNVPALDNGATPQS
jgi:hypothetical protein